MKRLMLFLLLFIPIHTFSKVIIDDRFELSKEVKNLIAEKISKKCPRLVSGGNEIKVSDVLKSISLDERIYEVEVKGNAYGQGDPEYHLELTITEDIAHSSYTTQVKNFGDCY